MICPYNYKKQVSVQVPTIDEETTIVTSEVIETKFVMAECQKRNCAVWSEGKCHYNG